MADKIIARRNLPFYAPCHKSAMTAINGLLADHHAGLRIVEDRGLGGSEYVLMRVYDPLASRFPPATMLAYFLKRKSDGLFFHGLGEPEWRVSMEGTSYFSHVSNDDGTVDQKFGVTQLIEQLIEDCGMEELEGLNPDEYDMVISMDPDEFDEKTRNLFLKANGYL